MLGTHFEECLRKHLCTNVMCFIHDESTNRIKVTERVLLEGKGLKHGYDKVTISLFLILLNYTYCGTWTELLNPLPPLIRQELFMNNNHSSVAQLTRYCQGYGGLSIPAWERENSMTRAKSRSKCGVLMGGVSELSSKFSLRPGWFWASVLLGFSNPSNSVESWNAHSILSCSKNFERWWRKSIVPFDLRSYCEFLFNFSDWSLGHKVSSSR